MEKQTVLDNTATGRPKVSKEDKLRAEKIFDWAVYGGLGWIANVAISLYAYEKITHGPEKFWQGTREKVVQPMQRYFEKATAKFTKNNDRISRLGTSFTYIFLLGNGGHLMAVPIYYCEKYKGQSVRWLHKQFGGNDTQKEAEKIQEEQGALALIDTQRPPEGWKVGIGRAASFSANVAIGMVADEVIRFKGNKPDSVEKGLLGHIQDRFANAIAALCSRPGIDKTRKVQRPFIRTLQAGGTDLAVAGIGALVLYTVTKSLQKVGFYNPKSPVADEPILLTKNPFALKEKPVKLNKREQEEGEEDTPSTTTQTASIEHTHQQTKRTLSV